MNKKQIKRNRTADSGRNNDPDLRDRSGQQPGVNTYSDTKDDHKNEEITETAGDHFDASGFGEDADKAYDEVDKDKD